MAEDQQKIQTEAIEEEELQEGLAQSSEIAGEAETDDAPAEEEVEAQADPAEATDEEVGAVPIDAAPESEVEEGPEAPAPVDEPSEADGPDGGLLEQKVEAAAESFEFPSAGDAGLTTEPEGPQTSVTNAAELRPTALVGFTGEIVGRVVKLEDLERDGDGETASVNYEQLMRLVDETFTNVTEQQIVKGRVVSLGEKDVVIDIGFKSDGVVSLNEFDRELAAGDEVEVFLERLEDRDGQLVLSKTKADQVRRWQRVEEAFENEQVLEGTIVRRIKGGMIVELFQGMEAFLPGSQIDVRPVRDFDAYLEKRMEFKIVKLNPANENIVVSHKALIEKELYAQREKILATMEPGQILEGTVKNITDFGVFIDLGGVDGLLHITDLSWGRVSHPSELVDLDEKLNVVVLDYDKERQRISLGLKQLQSHPWENILDKYAEGSTVEGKVVSITDYGAFVELEKGIEGLVHISEMSWTEHIRHPSQMVSLGQLVNVKILNIDHEGKKISLGMKQLQPDPWVGISDRYPPGTVMRGKVRNITNFGVFVEIEPGIDGLVHISDLSWTKKIRHPGEMVKKGQELDVVILNIDEKERRISLGHKQVETNPWNQFAKVYAEGTDSQATVARVNEGGIIVDLPMDVEAFVPASELKHGPQNFQEYYQPGQELALRVIKFDPNQKEIVLSEVAQERAAERADREAQERERRQERDRETREVREYQTKVSRPTKGEPASGPTTLGELSGLADLKAQIERAEHAASVEAEEAEAAQAEAAQAEPAEAEQAEAAQVEPAEAKQAEAGQAEETEAAQADAAPVEAEQAEPVEPEIHPAASKTIPESEHDDATVVDVGPTPEEQAEAEMEESDETVVTTAAASGELEGTPGVANRARAGKRGEEGGEPDTSGTEPPASRQQRPEDAGDFPPAEKAQAALKDAGTPEKEGAAEAAEAATQDETRSAGSGDKPIASVESGQSIGEIEASTKPTDDEKRAVTKDAVTSEEEQDEEKG